MVDEQTDMDNETISLAPNGKRLIPENYEELEKTDLIEILKESRRQFVGYEHSRHNLEIQVEQLEKDLNEQFQKCKRLEDDKAFLRNNIKKASTNWFERKAKLSESDNEHGSNNEEGGEQDGMEECQQRNDRAHILITEEAVKLFTELKYKDEQLELSELRCKDLNKRLIGYEKVIDDQEVIIHGLEKQLNTYFNDNQKMSKQLADLNKLFSDLEKANEKQVKPPDPIEEEGNASNENIPSEKDFKEMSKSVSKTYTKLKELIYEKKSLVTEIERLKTLNVELQFRVTQQESRLISVSDALQTTWLMVSNLKEEHAKLHTSETILRYELKEKREILRRLREELECSREQWHIIRQKNSETEQEWTILREEINARRKAEQFGEQLLSPEEVEEAVGGSRAAEKEFEPPIDLLVDMGIEYGIINADDEEPTTVVSLIGGEDVHADRLQNLEDQCCFLYQKLMSSTARALTLATRLSSLHQHYALSEEGDDDEDDEGEIDDDDDDNAYEVEAISPDSESYDTAYVSEVEGADSGSVTEGPPDLPSPTSNENTTILEELENGANEESSEEMTDDNCDILSRRLITFLPKKIEILKLENKKLEERLANLQEEKNKTEVSLNATIDIERRQRRQLEQQLTHLGKCVDELKLERNGKIAEVEEELRRKVEEVRKEEEEFVQLKDQLESLQEKYEQREQLLQISASQLEVTDQRASVAEEASRQLTKELQSLQEEVIKLKATKEKSSVAQTSQASQTDLVEAIGVADNQKAPQQINNATAFKDQVQPDNLKPIPHISEAQAEKLTIMTNSALRLPFQLDVGSSLCWTLGVHTEEITVSIVYEQLINSSGNKVDVPYNSPPAFRIGGSASATINPVITNELVEPHKIPASNALSKGTLTPRIPGRYSIILVNQTQKCQEISLKFWLQQQT